jgi:hypothetical protein
MRRCSPHPKAGRERRTGPRGALGKKSDESDVHLPQRQKKSSYLLFLFFILFLFLYLFFLRRFLGVS